MKLLFIHRLGILGLGCCVLMDSVVSAPGNMNGAAFLRYRSSIVDYQVFSRESLSPRALQMLQSMSVRIRAYVHRCETALGELRFSRREDRQKLEVLQQVLRHHPKGARIYEITDAMEDPNQPTPDLGSDVSMLMSVLSNNRLVLDRVHGDRVVEAMYTQTLSHLKNVSFSLRTEIGNDDYPHEFVLKGPYPYRPTLLALEKAGEFLEVMLGGSAEVLGQPQNPARKKEIMDEQKRIIAELVGDPMTSYQDFRNRLRQFGRNASFPEFSSIVEYLILELESDSELLKACRKNPALASYRSAVLTRLQSLPRECPYLRTFYGIERAVEFFDVWRRSQGSHEPIYHSAHYEYYLHALMGEIPDHIAFPTLADLSVEDFLLVRGVPIGFVGVHVDDIRVDGFVQTPYEMFTHDPNHARRMHQLAKERAQELGLDADGFYRRSNAFIGETLAPLFMPEEGDDETRRQLKMLTAVVLFEFMHEQSFPADPDLLLTQILRAPAQRTPFERIERDAEVVYYTEHRPTCLAYAFRKLAHDYFDRPGHRHSHFIRDEFRTRGRIVEVTGKILEALGLARIPWESLKEYVSSDDFPNASFRRGLQTDIDRRPSETVPLGFDESPTLQPLLLLKAQFQKTIQVVTPWDPSAMKFLSSRQWDKSSMAAPRIGYFILWDQPIQQSDVEQIHAALQKGDLDEVVIVFPRNSMNAPYPSVENVAMQALLASAVFQDDSRVALAVTAGMTSSEIERNLHRHYLDPELVPIRQNRLSSPTAEQLRTWIAAGERMRWVPYVPEEVASLIDRWALYRLPDQIGSRSIPSYAKRIEHPGSSTNGPLKAMRSVFSYPFPEVLALLKRVFQNYDLSILRGWVTPPGLDHYHVPIISKLIQFHRQTVPALSDFKFQYSTAGANEGIREALTKLARDGIREIYVFKGEYEGYKEVADSRGIQVVEVDEDMDPSTLSAGWWFISNPSGRDGNIISNENIRRICDAGHRVFYDLAYLGLTGEYAFDVSHPNIEGVFISFSKSFGIFSYRAGITFSRNPIDGLSGNIWFKILTALQIEEVLMEHFKDPLALPRIYRPWQTRIIERLSARFGIPFKASDVVLLAHVEKGVTLTEEQKALLERYRRGDLYRMTLTPYFLDLESERPLHRKARQPNMGAPPIMEVPDERVGWDHSWLEYDPPYRDSPEVLRQDRTKLPGGWADPSDYTSILSSLQSRISFEGPLRKDPRNGLLLNPMGRTGKAGRGELGAYGPNFAADPIVTRTNPETGSQEVLLVQRRDNGQWSLPGSMINSRDELLEFMRNGFARKVLGVRDGSSLEDVDGILDALFANGAAIYRGYMDDERNTDHAWMESVAVHFHASDAVARRLRLSPGEATSSVQWVSVSDILSGKKPLFANHVDLIRRMDERSRTPDRSLPPKESSHRNPPPSTLVAA